MIAALFVQRNGVYFGMPEVDAWDEERDARKYGGPFPVVAHPPCQRWGRYWGGAPSTFPRLVLGDDGGCFASALSAVRKWGGVLEHPEGSHAWAHFGLNTPPRCGGWIVADWEGGWTCCVEQGNYGHRARKPTWLYAHGFAPPPLVWWPSKAKIGEGEVYADEAAKRRAVKTGAVQRMGKRERSATPVPFRDLLISMARMAERKV